MSLHKSPISNEVQGNDLEEMSSQYLKDIDLDYRGYIFGKSFETKGVEAHVNRARAWLVSQPFDYVRERDKYSPLFNLVGEQEPHAEQWKQELTRAFNEQFAGDLEIKMCEVLFDNTNRGAEVRMIVQDKLTNKTFPVIAGVSR